MDIETYKYQSIGGDRITTMYDYYVTVTIGDNVHEGRIVLGKGDHGGESYQYVSHIEWEENELDEDTTEQIETMLEENIVEMVFGAKKL
jgi:hypothetical protein